MTFLKVVPQRKIGVHKDIINTNWNPTVDIIESKDSFTLHFDLPGFEKEQINVTKNKGILTVSGERKPTDSVDDKYYNHIERPEGYFSRSFRLPEVVDSENTKGTYKKGILSIELPKTEKSKSRIIEIK